MKELTGMCANAKIFTDNVEELALSQIQTMLDNEITKKTKVRIMSDVHAGKGSTIGTTIRLPEDFDDWKVCPNVVGVDVNCGIMMYKISDKEVNLERLDNIINTKIPSGFYVHDKPQDLEYTKNLLEKASDGMKRYTLSDKVNNRIHNSLGSLGGGNHFIELGKDEEGNLWLSVHSGSRNLGVQVAKHHQGIAINILKEKYKENKVDIREIVESLTNQGRQSEIEQELKDYKSRNQIVTKEMENLAYLEGALLKDYLNDMMIAQAYAKKSREVMLDIIVKEMEFTVEDKFDSAHNFIEHDNFKKGMIRKGATSAKKGERLVIPLNMRDGSLICKGKGNEDWNNSAPHGAGRLMSRTKARNELSLDDFHEQMKGIHSSSIGKSTLDEAPGAYKPAQEIIDNIGDTVEILHIVKPMYNFKAK